MLGNSCDHRILPGSEIEVPGLLRKNLRCALTCSVKEMNNRFVDGVSPRARAFLSLPPRLV